MSERHTEGMDLNESALGENCDTFLQAKQTKAPATGRLARLEKYQVVHSDIFGPVLPPTIGKSRYIVTFFVEKSKFAKVYTKMFRAHG